MEYKLTNAERETIIVFNEEEDEAIISTCNGRLIRKLDSRCAENTDCHRIKTDRYGSEYKVSKVCVKINFPPTITEETRAKMAQRAKNNFSKL